MKTIYFKYDGDTGKHPLIRQGFFALGDHPIERDGTDRISAQCVTLKEVEQEAQRLKQLIDDAVISARRKLPT